MADCRWVDTLEALTSAVEQFKGYSSLAFDAEMDSFFVYHTKLCLIQVTAGDSDYLIDPLEISDLSVLNAVTQDPSIRKVFHAGENDIPFFRDRGVEFKNLFDTHLAAKILELPSKGLAGLVELYFQVELSKEHQRSDWRLRPLSDEQLAYAQEDTRYLNRLADLLQHELVERELEEQAWQEFVGVERFSFASKQWDPNGWARIKGANELTGLQRAVAAGLFAWREQVAEREDQALFRVLNNATLLALTRRRFSSQAALQQWLKSKYLKDRAAEIFAVVTKALDGGPILLPDLGKKKYGGLSPEEESLFQRLREWRNEESLRSKVEPERVFSNKQLKRIVRRGPLLSEDLKELSTVEPWRIEKYGSRILEVLREPIEDLPEKPQAEEPASSSSD